MPIIYESGVLPLRIPTQPYDLWTIHYNEYGRKLPSLHRVAQHVPGVSSLHDSQSREVEMVIGRAGPRSKNDYAGEPSSNLPDRPIRTWSNQKICIAGARPRLLKRCWNSEHRNASVLESLAELIAP
jgi:hypothetical protein